MMWDDSATPKKIELQIIPMIDIMMFLMVFFVLLSINVMQAKGMKTTLPSSTQTVDILPSKIMVTIAASGLIQVNEKFVTLDHLTSALAEEKSKFKEVYLVVKGDKQTPLQSLISVMDAAKQAGIEDIGIAERPK
jgi:biopolymer transport protein ExbD